ncbi:MAG: repeat containing protein [Cyanobacteria bacterium RYN_339]|nr:repeat containing protein [Cyanobacteria bacterium RYN_339]
MRGRWLLGLALTCAVGCQGSPLRTVASPRPKVTTAPVASTRPVEAAAVAIQVAGQVRLIGEHGGGIISNNTGSLVSNNGGQIISNHGGGLRLLAAAEEALLADAAIDVLDGEGRVLTGADGQPIGAVSNGQGAYAIQAKLPAENLILRVKLHGGGELRALLPEAAKQASRAQDLDTASTLGASYVLSRYVKGSKDIYARLPRAEADTLQAAMEIARALLPAGPPAYQEAELAKAVDALRSQAPQLDQALARIEALLLVGQQHLGEGLDATSVPLVTPWAVIGDGAGGLLIGETFGSRIRRRTPAGKLQLFAGGNKVGAPDDALGANVQAPASLVRATDGTIYMADSLAHTVRAISPAGKIRTVAGNGTKGQSGVGGPATDAQLYYPTTVALLPDGTLLIGEAPEQQLADGSLARLLALGADGKLRVEPFPAGLPLGYQAVGLAPEPDGGLWLLGGSTKQPGQLYHRPVGGAWAMVASGFSVDSASRICLARDGGVYVSETDAMRITRVRLDGTQALLAGSGSYESSGDGGPAASAGFNHPSGLWLSPEGTLYVCDYGSGLVRTIDLTKPGNPVSTVAGATGVSQVGNTTSIAVNGPAGLALDPQGRLVMTEAGSSTIKRLEGTSLVVVAGTTKGHAGDGGSPLAARLGNPAGICFQGNDLYVADTFNGYIRKITGYGGAAPIISNLAGAPGAGIDALLRSQPADAVIMTQPTDLKFGADGLLYWTDNTSNQVLRLKGDQVEVVAGALDRTPGDGGDGGPAAAALLNKPVGLAFDKAGNLYVADAGNMRVRKITPDGTISTAVGVGLGELLGRLSAGKLDDAPGTPAAKVALVAPAGLCFDEAGNLYLSELGTGRLGGLGLALGDLPRVGSRIRKVELGKPGAPVTAIAGQGTALLNGDDVDDALQTPLGLLFDAQGRFIVADGGNNQVKVLPKGSF